MILLRAPKHQDTERDLTKEFIVKMITSKITTVKWDCLAASGAQGELQGTHSAWPRGGHVSAEHHPLNVGRLHRHRGLVFAHGEHVSNGWDAVRTHCGQVRRISASKKTDTQTQTRNVTVIIYCSNYKAHDLNHSLCKQVLLREKNSGFRWQRVTNYSSTSVLQKTTPPPNCSEASYFHSNV